MSIINVLITFETKPEFTDAFAKLLNNISKKLLLVDGCHQALAKVCEDNPQGFMMLETWQSKEAHAKHLNTVITSGAWEKNCKTSRL